MSLRFRHLLFCALTTITPLSTGCGSKESQEPAATSPSAPAPEVPTAKPEEPIPGNNATQRAANVRIILLGMASQARGDVAKFVAEADAFFAERKEGLAKLEAELTARNKELGSSPDAKEKILAQAPEEMHLLIQAQFMLQTEGRDFMSNPEVKKRLERIGL